MKRLLLCTTALPTPDNPLAGAWNLSQARALCDIGVQTELFQPTVAVPRWLAWVSPRLRRHHRREERFSLRGVPVRAPKVAFAYPHMVRFQLARAAPGMVTRWMHWAVGPALRRAIGEFAPDGLLAHAANPWGRTAVHESARAGIPCAFIEHSGRDILRLRASSRLGRCYLKAARRAKGVLLVGQHQLEHLRDELGLANARLILNGVDPPTELQMRTPRPPQMADQLVVLSAAMYYRLKGFEELVEAFSRIAARHPSAHLYLITAPPPALHDRITALEVRDRIHVLGPRSHEEVLQWMVWADLYAMPSWSEGFPLVFGEAMIARTPVIMSNECGTASFITPFDPAQPSERGHGWVVSPREVDALAETLDTALADPERLRLMGEAAQQLAQSHLTWEQNARTVVETIWGSDDGV